MIKKLEYIWLDGYKPTQSLRSKTRTAKDFGGTLEECPIWSFDGSSTEQAAGNDSDCLLKPVAIFPDPCRKNGYLVMAEVLNADGTPHESNGRATINDDDDDFWFGFEQEYFLWDVNTKLPPGFPAGGYPGPQGPYYCSVGAKNAYGRPCVDDHLDACLEAGINVEGINAEVASGQWEFQVFAKGAKRAGDETWVARWRHRPPGFRSQGGHRRLLGLLCGLVLNSVGFVFTNVASIGLAFTGVRFRLPCFVRLSRIFARIFFGRGFYSLFFS